MGRVSDEDFAKARDTLSVDAARVVAERQLKLTDQCYSDIPFYVRSRVHKPVIENARMNFNSAESEKDQDRKQLLYLLSWRAGRAAVDDMSKDIDADKIHLYEVLKEYTIDKVANKMADAGDVVLDKAGKAGEKVKQTMKDAASGATEITGNIQNILIMALIGYGFITFGPSGRRK